jgi:hypothetical protein
MEICIALSISRFIVEEYAGCLWVAGNSPHGASFLFHPAHQNGD